LKYGTAILKYHPDPTSTGSVTASDNECVGCGQIRGYIYVGPAYATANLSESICPWCISDGTAHQKFKAMFLDDAGVGGYNQWDAVPKEVVAEVVHRTPGFSGWQQEQWWTHCGDAAEFLGVAGYEELQQHGEESCTSFVSNSATTPTFEAQNWTTSSNVSTATTAQRPMCSGAVIAANSVAIGIVISSTNNAEQGAATTAYSFARPHYASAALSWVVLSLRAV
jgi:uncharacterized protein CbrC (UPF0167 family)